MTYFKDCTNVQELKKAYRKFCMELHPDLAGKETEEEFKRMNEEYTSCLKHLSNVENLSDIENDSVHDWKNDKFAEIIQQIIKFDSMRIEIIGEWIWCFDSYQYKEQLKKLGFWFSGSKKAWVYNGNAKKGKGHYSINKLHAKWGFSEVKTEKQEKLS